MIYFLTTKRHDYTIRKCLRSEGKCLQAIVQPMCYAALFLKRRFPRGTYVFADHERLTESDLDKLHSVCEQLRRDPHIRLLNLPDRTLGRLALLERLHQAGINDFTGYRLEDQPRPQRFPVFVRGEDDHKGPLSSLIETQPELDAVYEQWSGRWGKASRKLVIEHCDVADEHAVYRKYAAFRIGDAILPRHLFFGSNWCVKSWELLDEHLLAEEREYIDAFPHHDQLQQIFDLAGVEFGRIDYGVRDGKLQVWEINTNPMLPVNYGGGGSARQALHEAFNQRFNDAMRVIDTPCDVEGESSLSVRPAVPIWAAPALAARFVYRRATRGQRKKVAV
ncbi:hypothetical protein [Rhodopirellula sp. MGV]|uniref:hypothetical protein n=1 Tax=Rhodopirellula sp. MGV TaxID=2023130 RepID=UPI00117A7E73|nr:hypothetical protein [Rhodopirellula sp. MGV]